MTSTDVKTEWRNMAILGFSNYSVSPDGRVMNITRSTLMYNTVRPDRYLIVSLTNDNREKKGLLVHRAVALMYIPNPENKPTVNHKDHKRDNNNVNNLEWATHSEQILDAYKFTKMVTMKARQIGKFEYDNATVAVYSSVREAAKSSHKTLKEIRRLCNENRNGMKDGIYWTYYDLRNIPGESFKELNMSSFELLAISTIGRVYVPRLNRVLSGTKKCNGYRTVGIKDRDGKKLVVTVHGLVANAFFGPSNLFVDHINGQKDDNRYENLRYVTASQNVQHAHDTKLINQSRISHRVIQYDLAGNEIARFDSLTKAAIATNTNRQCITDCCSGKDKRGYNRNSAKGFVWRFEDKNVDGTRENKIALTS